MDGGAFWAHRHAVHQMFFTKDCNQVTSNQFSFRFIQFISSYYQFAPSPSNIISLHLFTWSWTLLQPQLDKRNQIDKINTSLLFFSHIMYAAAWVRKTLLMSQQNLPNQLTDPPYSLKFVKVASKNINHRRLKKLKCMQRWPKGKMLQCTRMDRRVFLECRIISSSSSETVVNCFT